MPTIEIWNVECVNVTIRQVEYFRETKSFASEKDAFIVYEKMIQVMDLIEHYAECGEKRLPEKPNFKGAPYYAYINEVIFGDNSILVELNDNKIVYINHGNYHYIMTRDERFGQFTHDHFQNIIRRSTPISSANEKDRKRFFNRVRDRVFKRMKEIV
ncbi:MAG: hypothetical protein ICV81_04990 [Flavisolibacter sp.]|nr:hypothetical protein [Flavisolibacter sp.]